ncbi:MAG: iron-sulfur cluster assembly scaffold protein [Candidatus Saccharibacteria bacterium]|nr:iron-sulfur cluster assembly scaffold protein [Candidatus Saccharibacteria bacterium]
MNEGQDWVYSEIVKEHFLNPRNYLMGDESKFKYDAMGIVGNPICGDQMKMYIKVSDGKIADIRWKTYGCASAIASTSALSELAKGKTLDEAVKISAKDIDNYLGNLPKHKFHCSILGHDALREAVENYKKEQDGKKKGSNIKNR